MITLTMLNAIASVEIAEEVFHNWNDILCDNCFNYECDFYLYYGDGFSMPISDNSIIGLLGQAQEKGISPNDEVLINGCITTCSEAIALSPFISDTGARWDSEADFSWDNEEDIPEYVSIVHNIDDSDVPF
jgi:hypothetical protein